MFVDQEAVPVFESFMMEIISSPAYYECTDETKTIRVPQAPCTQRHAE